MLSKAVLDDPSTWPPYRDVILIWNSYWKCWSTGWFEEALDKNGPFFKLHVGMGIYLSDEDFIFWTNVPPVPTEISGNPIKKGEYINKKQ